MTLGTNSDMSLPAVQFGSIVAQYACNMHIFFQQTYATTQHNTHNYATASTMPNAYAFTPLANFPLVTFICAFTTTNMGNYSTNY